MPRSASTPSKLGTAEHPDDEKQVDSGEEVVPGRRKALAQALIQTKAMVGGARGEDEQDKDDQAAAHKRSNKCYDRQGIVSSSPSLLSPLEACERCLQVVKREAERLPQSLTDERTARKRLSRNKTEALLKSGMSFDAVVRVTAMRVVEEWLRVLRHLVHNNTADLVQTIITIVHSSDRPYASLGDAASAMVLKRDVSGKLTGMVVPTINAEKGVDGVTRLHLIPNPTPPATTPLGKALRELVPDNTQTCGFIVDTLAALKLEDDYIATSPTHILRPNTAMRNDLSDKQEHEDALDEVFKAPCLRVKDLANSGTSLNSQATKTQPNRKRADNGLAAAMRKSGTMGWGTFSQSETFRKTALGNSAEYLLDMPGPGEYKRPVSVMRPSRVGFYRPVGGRRPPGHAVMGSTYERFR